MSISLAKITDLDELERLFDELNACLEGVYYGPEWKKGIYPTRMDAKNAIEDKSLYVFKENERILGSISLNHVQEAAYSDVSWSIDPADSEILVIRLLTVHPDSRGRGVSSKLLEFAKNVAAFRGSKTIRLDVVNQNVPACMLYEKSGFTYVATVDLGLPYDKLKWFRLYEFIVPLTIRLATEKDLKEISDILNSATLKLQRLGVNQWEYPWNIEVLRSEIDKNRIYVIENEQRLAIATFAIKQIPAINEFQLEENSLYFYQLAVSSEFQKSGVGAEIMNLVKKQFNRPIYLDCYAGNDVLKNFYHRSGFNHVEDVAEDDYFVSVLRVKCK